jgi:hypothetical protein
VVSFCSADRQAAHVAVRASTLGSLSGLGASMIHALQDAAILQLAARRGRKLL